MQLQKIEAIEKHHREAADTLRANSDFKSSEYSTPATIQIPFLRGNQRLS